MNIKGILKTLNKHGVKGTITTYKKRRDAGLAGTGKPMQEEERTRYDELLDAIAIIADSQMHMHPRVEAARPILRKYNAACLMRVVYSSSALGNGEKLAQIESIVEEINGMIEGDVTDEELTSLDERMRELETGPYRKFLKRVFVGRLMPQLYDQMKDLPVEEKIVFMQPREGLNQSFKYIFNRIKKDFPYEPVLCELHYGQVSTAEHYVNALGFVRESATARAIMLHESSAYLSHMDIRPETKVVQLWHGCGIIKHLGLSNADKPGFKKMSTFMEFPEHQKYDLVTMAGEEMRWVFEEFMGLPKDDPVLQAIGVSRTDEFYDEEYVKKCYDTLHRLIPQSENKKVILYAPTYRGKGVHRYAPDALDIAAMAKELSDDYVLIIKQHQTVKELPKIPEGLEGVFAWDMTRSEDLDINQLMTVADICISDYSSVIFEYSLFERPIIFFMFDLDEYSDSRGMYYSYEELAECGPVFKTNEEMIDYLKHIDERFDKQKVIDFKNRFMSACDGHSTERIIAFIES